MAFDESDELHQVAQIMLQLPRLILDSEIRAMFALAWGCKKHRTMLKFARLSSCKTPVSFPNSKLRITLKRKGSENGRHQNSSRSGGNKRRSCFSVAAEDESSINRKKVSGRSCNSSDSDATFFIPDLNLLPPFTEEDENCDEQREAHKPKLPLLGTC